MEVLLWQFSYGKPKDTLAIENPLNLTTAEDRRHMGPAELNAELVRLNKVLIVEAERELAELEGRP